MSDQPPQKQRPRALWFVVGVALMIAGVALGVSIIVTGVKHLTVEDGTFMADGAPHRVTAPPNRSRMVFAPSGSTAPSCAFVDGGGKKLAVRAIFGGSTLTTGGNRWRAFGQLDSSGDGNVTATCTSSPGATAEVRMGAPVTVSGLGGALVAGVGALLLLGGLGFVVLLVTTILWVTRKPDPAGSAREASA